MTDAVVGCGSKLRFHSHSGPGGGGHERAKKRKKVMKYAKPSIAVVNVSDVRRAVMAYLCNAPQPDE